MLSVNITPVDRVAAAASPADLRADPTNAKKLGSGATVGTISRVPLEDEVYSALTETGVTPARFENMLWATPFHFSNPSSQLDYSESKVREIARWARDGGQNWRYDYTPPVKFVGIDVEFIPQTAGYQDRIIQICQWFKSEAPNVAIGLYGFNPGWNVQYGVIREDFGSTNPTIVQKVDNMMESLRPLMNVIDVYVQDCYLMGPERLQKDFAYMANHAAESREHYPDVPFVGWLWGSWHETWNPGAPELSPRVAGRYADVAMNNFDALVVWGPHRQNENLKAAVARLPHWRVNLPRPATSTLATDKPSDSPFGDRIVTDVLGAAA